jgi:hypothetical protein
MYFLFHNDYQFSEGSKVKPWGLKNLNFKDKKISRKIFFLSDIISISGIVYPVERQELRFEF